VQQFAEIVKLYIESEFGAIKDATAISPVMKSKYKQLQITGKEAGLFFMDNYRKIPSFEKGILEDARIFGDGYDFQIQVAEKYLLAEIKGIRSSFGSIRLTKNEFIKAGKYKDDYGLVVVSNLDDIPKMTALFNPINNITLTKQVVTHSQVTYHSEALSW
jgi:hypothetical protein